MLENLTLDRVIVHEVLTAADFSKRKPNHSSTTIELDDKGRDLICDRLVEAIGSASHCEEMLVANAASGSAFQAIADLFDQDQKDFTSATALLADRLSGAQAVGSVKEGLGVFLQGTGEEDGGKLRWIAIIKADPDRGFVKEIEGSKITLRYVANLIMGAQQRMLKVALIIEAAPRPHGSKTRDGSDFSIKIYDHLLSISGRGTAALYFYSSFLGLKPAENSAKLCRDFFEKTRVFTDELSIDNGEKVTFRGHLASYLRSEKEQISAREFAETYLPTQHRRAYLKKMQEDKFPDHAVRRDIRLIKAKLKKQSLKFTSKIVIVGSDDALQTSIVFGNVIRENDEDWTELKIKGKLE